LEVILALIWLKAISHSHDQIFLDIRSTNRYFDGYFAEFSH